MKASACMLLATIGVSTAQAAPQIVVIRAEWGSDKGGPTCDATQGVAASCSRGMNQDGTACNVYASNSYCNDA